LVVTAPLGVIAAAEPGVDELALALAGTSRFALPIGGLPLVVRALQALRAAGAEEVLVVASRRSDGDVRDLLHAHDGSLSFAVVDPTGGAGASLGPAVAHADGRSLLVHASDGFLTGTLPTALEGFDAVAAGRPDAPVLLLDPDAARTAADLDAADLGRLADELERGGSRVSRRRAVAGWRYRGDVETLLEGNRLALDELPGGAPEGHIEEARIEGRVAIHPTAIVERSRVRGPAWICRGAVITDAFVGPYSMIGDRVELEGAEIEHSLVLTGASIRHLDRRLEESIVGRGATVRRQFSLPASIRMRVGAGAEVLLA
jgi:NDP-sugar pyrophosphorylase family protein